MKTHVGPQEFSPHPHARAFLILSSRFGFQKWPLLLFSDWHLHESFIPLVRVACATHLTLRNLMILSEQYCEVFFVMLSYVIFSSNFKGKKLKKVAGLPIRLIFQCLCGMSYEPSCFTDSRGTDAWQYRHIYIYIYIYIYMHDERRCLNYTG
jgi:hypothetical protein